MFTAAPSSFSNSRAPMVAPARRRIDSGEDGEEGLISSGSAFGEAADGVKQFTIGDRE